jgi:putative transposase
VISEHRASLGTLGLCKAFGMARATFYRAIKKVHSPHTERPANFRRIPDEQRQQIIATLNSERFCDMSPPEVFTTLLDKQIYLCSIRSMYRILSENHQNVQRRQSHPRNLPRPELLATKPNQLWSWDITKLKGPFKWTYFYLYKILDVFSRYVVGWMVAFKESSALAEALIGDTCLKQKIVPGTLTVHADNGPSMTSKPVAYLLIDLGVAKTHSRPHVSNDNPFSEAAFKTLKYRPDFPEMFGSLEDSRSFCQNFFRWYNHEHHHAGIAMFSPYEVHYGLVDRRATQRKNALDQAYRKNPERFVKGTPVVNLPPKEVWINKPNVKENVKEHAQNVSLNTINQLSHFY